MHKLCCCFFPYVFCLVRPSVHHGSVSTTIAIAYCSKNSSGRGFDTGRRYWRFSFWWQLRSFAGWSSSATLPTCHRRQQQHYVFGLVSRFLLSRSSSRPSLLPQSTIFVLFPYRFRRCTTAIVAVVFCICSGTNVVVAAAAAA